MGIFIKSSNFDAEIKYKLYATAIYGYLLAYNYTVFYSSPIDYVSPLYTEVGTCWFNSVVLSVLVCESHSFLFSVFYRAGGQTRDIDPMLG